MLKASREDREHPGRDEGDRPAWIGRLRLFALLALLVPLFAGLQFLVREAVPRIEIRFVSQDVPVNVPVVVPVERVVERIVYVEVERPAPDSSQSVDSFGAAGTESAQEPSVAVSDQAPASESIAEDASAAESAIAASPPAGSVSAAPAPPVNEPSDEPAQVAEDPAVEAAPAPAVITERVARIAPSAVSSIAPASTEPWRVEIEADVPPSAGDVPDATEAPEATAGDDEASDVVADEAAPDEVDAGAVAESTDAQSAEDEQASAKLGEDAIAESGDESPELVEESVAANDGGGAMQGLSIGQAGIGVSVSDAVSVLQDVAREKADQPAGDEDAAVHASTETAEALMADDGASAQAASAVIDEPEAASDADPVVADATSDEMKVEESVVANSADEAPVEESVVGIVADEHHVAEPSEPDQTSDVAALSSGAVASVEQVITEAIPEQ